MKNLKLLNWQYECKISEIDSFCHDFDGNAYFASKDTLYCFSNEKKLSVCAKLEEYETSFIVGVEHILDANQVFIASSSGNIYSYDIYSNEISTVGIVDSRIENFAWSPDQEFLIILTGANTLILMTKDFDPVTEKSLCPEEFGESEPITVGWGSKETQFHGSEGKDAAKIKQIEPKPALPYDDSRSRVSWRGDGEYFVTSSIHSSKGFRQLHIWSREAVLQFTGEIKDGLEEPICWRPLGDLIACSQQHATKHKIIFFEKNGLQHGEFVLPFKPNTHKINYLLWNPDSTVLLIVAEPLEKPSYFKVMLWSCGNGHWYLKQTFSLPKQNSQKSVVIKWNVKDPYELFFLNQATEEFYRTKWTWTISSSLGVTHKDVNCDALVASIDNDNLLVTPFNKMIVPPPMCACTYRLTSSIQNVCFSPTYARFCCCLESSCLTFFEKISQDVENSKIVPYVNQGTIRINLNDIEEPSNCNLYHWTWVGNKNLLCISSSKQKNSTKYALMIFTVPVMLESATELIGSLLANMECSVVGMSSDVLNKVAVQLSNGKVLKIAIDEDQYTSPLSSPPVIEPWLCKDGSPLVLPQQCITMSNVHINGEDLFLGLTEKYTLFCNSKIISSNCTSYYVHDDNLLITTTDHILQCFPFDDLSDFENGRLKNDIPFLKTDKGPKIIIAPPNDTKVILQMPRGNLETVHPTPLVLSCVYKHLDNSEYDKAVELCKTHRIDLNILYDYHTEKILENVKLFIKQLNGPKHLMLFVETLQDEDIYDTLYAQVCRGKTHIGKIDQRKSKIDAVYDAILKVLESNFEYEYLPIIVMMYAKRKEPRLDLALSVLKHHAAQHPVRSLDWVQKSLGFLIHLVGVDKLIDAALGTYDLEIFMMVATQLLKDPNEILPYYNELQELEENYKKYKIDVILQRYKLALCHIGKCEDKFEECMALIKDQKLYVDALNLFPPASVKYKTVWKEYGIYLKTHFYYDEAGLAFTKCEDYEEALLAYKMSLNWRCMLSSAIKLGCSDESIRDLCLETAEKLKSKQKYLEASFLFEYYVKDIEESIVILVDGYEWNQALYLMSKYGRNDLEETYLKPALKEYYTFLNDHLQSLSSTFIHHVDRLLIVRSKKINDLESSNTVQHHHEEMFSETGSVTDVASSVAESKQLSGSIKSSKKSRRKKYSLKEGSPNEDLALIAALSETIVKVDNLKDNFFDTLKTMVQFGFDAEAKTLQLQLCELVSRVEKNLTVIWSPIENDSVKHEMKFGPDSTANSITTLLQSQPRNLDPLPTDPELKQPSWRKINFELQMFK